MLSDLLFGFGFVALVEGLILALFPGRLADLLQMLRAMPPSTLRLVGLTAATLGVLMVTVARS